MARRFGIALYLALASGAFAATVTQAAGDCPVITSALSASDSASPLGVQVSGPVHLEYTAPPGDSSCLGSWTAESTIHLTDGSYLIGVTYDFDYTLASGADVIPGTASLLWDFTQEVLGTGANIGASSSIGFGELLVTGHLGPSTTDSSGFGIFGKTFIPGGDYTIRQTGKLTISVNGQGGGADTSLAADLAFPVTSFVTADVPEPGTAALVAGFLAAAALRLLSARRSVKPN